MWRQHPVSRVLLEYLRDHRIHLAEGIAKEIFNGRTVLSTYLEEVAFKCGIMQDVETLDADDINRFYGVEEPTPEEKEKK